MLRSLIVLILGCSLGFSWGSQVALQGAAGVKASQLFATVVPIFVFLLVTRLKPVLALLPTVAMCMGTLLKLRSVGDLDFLNLVKPLVYNSLPVVLVAWGLRRWVRRKWPAGTESDEPTIATSEQSKAFHVKPDWPFYVAMVVLGGFYLTLIVGMLAAKASFTSSEHVWAALKNEEIQYSIKLSLISCSMAAICSLWVAVPLGYLLSRYEFRGKQFVDGLLDIPIILPPLVVGLGLLILFSTPVGQAIEEGVDLSFDVNVFGAHLYAVNLGRTPGIPFTYAVPGVILAQFMVACAFAVRTMRVTFDQISPRQEQVALTLGCTRSQAFWSVVMPQARRGILTAGTLAWARSLGEFGPILIFGGATRLRTDVMPTRVYLELTEGDLETAAAVSILMVLIAAIVLPLVRVFGYDPSLGVAKKR